MLCERETRVPEGGEAQTHRENPPDAARTERHSMSIESIAKSHGFTLLGSEEIPEIEGSAHVLRHDASKARLLYLKNDDPNKAFCISFKTPAADDTGVFHILEHSVLCGSDKFPVKEPFVNLLKSSMQTFLNAMTFPDKTMYPVASTNEQDLVNLMDVYLDAVFHPAIYQKRAIFEQEGWHYERTGDEENPLCCNGVVFNEMKGALSDPDSVLYDALSAALFPDTTYRFESGGVPTAIPELTYEGFLNSHERHYRPDNSYITLSGNLNLDLFLKFIDEQYLAPLSNVERGPLDVNPLEKQAPVQAEGVRQTMDTSPENAACALGFVIGDASERERIIAVDILLDAIMGSNEAPLKRALLDANLAADASSFVADALLQPFAVIQLKGLRDCSPQKTSEFKDLVMREAKRLADGELDRKLISAALSHAEFVMREGNFGYADGVLYAMTSMSGWLYDDELATAYLRYDDIFKSLRAKIDEGYFEKLLRELVLENPHSADVTLVPAEREESEAASTDADAEDLTARLKRIAQDMAPEDLEGIDREVERLRTTQEAPDAPENLAKLPQLGISDIGDAPAEPGYRLEEGHPLPLLRHEASKHGIAYAYRYFGLERVAFEDLPYVTVMAMVLGKLDTGRYDAAQLDTLIQERLGNFSVFAEVHESIDDRQSFSPKLVVSTSALDSNAEYLARFAREILTESRFTCQDKIYDALVQKKVAMEQGFASAGHSAAMARVASYYLPAAVVREQIGGMDFYFFLKDLVENYEERADTLSGKLAELAQLIFTDDNCLLSWSGSDEALSAFWQAEAVTNRTLPDGTARLEAPAPQVRNEAFAVASDVTYTAVGYDRRLLGQPAYSGSWLVASRTLSYDYLWNEVRVKGGAYGCGFQMTRPGSARFYSYRDPRIDETVERFRQAGSWLESFTPSESEMCGYVVSTTAGFDAPQKPRELMRRQDGQFFAGYDPEKRLKIREEIVATSAEDVRGLGTLVSDIADQGLVCTFGNREVIEKSSQDFTLVDPLA